MLLTVYLAELSSHTVCTTNEWTAEGTVEAALPLFRLVDPAHCGNHPLVTHSIIVD